jgi:DEAD/DEAH box helicase domain-containing protein
LAQQLTSYTQKQDDIILVHKDGSPHGNKQIVLWNPPRSDEKVDRTLHYRQKTQTSKRKESALQKYAYVTSLSLQDELRRKSTHVEAAILTAHLIQRNLKTITFAATRKVCELVTSLTHGFLAATSSTRALIPLLKSYRGGYTVADRRKTEVALFTGKLRGVVATTALELGIDVGSLDSTVHISMPLSASTLW